MSKKRKKKTADQDPEMDQCLKNEFQKILLSMFTPNGDLKPEIYEEMIKALESGQDRDGDIVRTE